MEFNLTVGMTAEKQEQVTPDNTAMRYGSGSAAVYATPAMVGLMEGTCLAAVDPHLPEGMATVGIRLDVRHLAATPIGLGVRATAELIEVAGKRLTFKMEAFDDKEKIGEGIHERYIIDVKKFMEKAQSKK
ncbi:thioesterase [Anaerosporomusa subterranea]|uniref:Thioesterase n=1 Tax=Anaerosporomusa subterranea TaxID=1794912 RepID=A0A154BVU7_ANASB|nr:thioesterase family protein [Anaerosporomusa subterranea]KYZ78062.1 thioesterase [Anaerosporomusa subterranea]